MKILETERLYLRVFEESDVNAMSEIHTDEAAMKYIGRGGVLNIEQTKKGIEAFIRYQTEKGYSIWAVIEKESGSLIGHCGLNMLNDKSDIEIAYLLAKEYWGKGYATEIAKATLEYGFTKLNLKRIVALAFPENLPSHNVIKKIGMKPEGEKDLSGIRFLKFSIEN